MKRPNTFIFSLLMTTCAIAQEPETGDSLATEEATADESYDNTLLSGTFYATRIINGHSAAVLPKGTLEYRIEHRFGDLAGANGGAQTWFGFDNAADIRMAFEYGLTKNLMAGFGRSKGTGNPYKSLLDGFLKYRILEQTKTMPVSLAVVGLSTYTYMTASTNSYDLTYFPKQAHRFAYTAEAIITKTFGRRISAALIPSYVHRNYVKADDVNGLFAVGGAIKCGITAQMGIIAEYYQVLTPSTATVRPDNTNSFGVAVEWITFGHTFTVNVTNSRGFNETQFIPYTFERWKDGQFRLGFSITRKFSWE